MTKEEFEKKIAPFSKEEIVAALSEGNGQAESVRRRLLVERLGAMRRERAEERSDAAFREYEDAALAVRDFVAEMARKAGKRPEEMTFGDLSSLGADERYFELTKKRRRLLERWLRAEEEAKR